LNISLVWKNICLSNFFFLQSSIIKISRYPEFCKEYDSFPPVLNDGCTPRPRLWRKGEAISEGGKDSGKFEVDEGKTCEKYNGRRINEQCIASNQQIQWQSKNKAWLTKGKKNDIQYIQIGAGPWVKKNPDFNVCAPCSPGSFQVADVYPDGQCEMSMLMASSTNENCVHQKEKCEKCPIGQYQDAYGGEMCKDCPMGFASGPCTQCRQQGWDGKMSCKDQKRLKGTCDDLSKWSMEWMFENFDKQSYASCKF
jgi:hypothetical protein